jgi:hypothetical protein
MEKELDQPKNKFVRTVAQNAETKLLLQLAWVVFNLLNNAQINQSMWCERIPNTWSQFFDELSSNANSMRLHIKFVACYCRKHCCFVWLLHITQNIWAT